jgi:hypothetical protein
MTETFLPQLHTSEARLAVAEVLLALFDRWGLAKAKQAELLGLPDTALLRAGQPLPDAAEVLERAGLLLAIDRALRRLYPDDRVLCDDWVAFPNSELGGLSPLAVMSSGLEGIRTVRTLLESA